MTFEGIAFLAIITAAITSTFVARAERERTHAEHADASQQTALAGRGDGGPFASSRSHSVLSNQTQIGKRWQNSAWRGGGERCPARPVRLDTV